MRSVQFTKDACLDVGVVVWFRAVFAFVRLWPNLAKTAAERLDEGSRRDYADFIDDHLRKGSHASVRFGGSSRAAHIGALSVLRDAFEDEGHRA